MFGGLALANFCPYNRIARMYCWPRKTSSSSFSRRAICFQVGIATVIRIAAMLMATKSAAIA